MRADPEPDHVFVVENAEGPNIEINSYGVDWTARVEVLKNADRGVSDWRAAGGARRGLDSCLRPKDD